MLVDHLKATENSADGIYHGTRYNITFLIFRIYTKSNRKINMEDEKGKREKKRSV